MVLNGLDVSFSQQYDEESKSKLQLKEDFILGESEK